jgi:solute carrier family 25 (peroxisomal adenine nucleotide transporter), member 17
MTGGGNSIVDSAPPMAHAVGGSLGSALALLLLYPLERARVEMQTMTAATSTSTSTSTTTRSAVGKDINDKVKPLKRGGDLDLSHQATPKLLGVPNNDNVEAACTNQSSRSEESWESALCEATDADTSSTSLAVSLQPPSKIGLLACIYQLHQRNQLYRGVTPVVTTMALSNFVFFYFHSYLKQLLLKSSSSAANLQLSLVASTLAGIANVLLTNPLWVANLRIVTSGSTNTNLWKEIKSILLQEGWQHLWNGTPASLLLVSNPVIQFVSYEQLKNQLQNFYRAHNNNNNNNNNKHSALSVKPMEAFLLGALAKAISTVLTYPLQLAQTVLRAQKDDPTTVRTEVSEEPPEQTSSTNASAAHMQPIRLTALHPYKGTLDCLVQIYRQKGIEGWFAGMRTKLLQTVLTAAFTFLTYEQIIRAIMAVHKGLQESARKRTLVATTIGGSGYLSS